MSKMHAMKATAEMQKCKISFVDVTGYAQKAIDLVNTTGTQFVGLLNDGFKVYAGITGQDFVSVFAALNDANANGAAIVAAIKTTFDI